MEVGVGLEDGGHEGSLLLNISFPDNELLRKLRPFFGAPVKLTVLALAATNVEADGRYNKVAVVHMDGAPETQSTNLCE